jgi:pilus assembly protein CpaB
MRAVSVRVNEVIGVAGYVLPGTHVDVVATATPTKNAEDVMSKVVLQNVKVLAAGTKLEETGPDNKPIPVNVVTLLVKPDESERLTLASTEGKIQLALRNPLDTAEPATPGIKPSILLGYNTYLAPRPAPVKTEAAEPKPAPEPEIVSVEVIRGDKRAREVVR